MVWYASAASQYIVWTLENDTSINSVLDSGRQQERKIHQTEREVRAWP